jgi:hypothetical protein
MPLIPPIPRKTVRPAALRDVRGRDQKIQTRIERRCSVTDQAIERHHLQGTLFNDRGGRQILTLRIVQAQHDLLRFQNCPTAARYCNVGIRWSQLFKRPRDDSLSAIRQQVRHTGRRSAVPIISKRCAVPSRRNRCRWSGRRAEGSRLAGIPQTRSCAGRKMFTEQTGYKPVHGISVTCGTQRGLVAQMRSTEQ